MDRQYDHDSISRFLERGNNEILGALCAAGVVSEADCILSKAFLAGCIFTIMVSTFAVHLKALGWALWAATYR
jgi:hypothetical protein